jgi:copper resistance protein C
MSRIRLSVLGIVVVAAAVVAPAVPAFAHDQLIASSPQVDEQLDVAPTEVTLEFSNDVLTLGGNSTIVIVADAAGRNWVDGSPVVTDRVVTTALLEGMPAAAYEVRWQVVSIDGHPISGVIPFRIGDETSVAETATPTPSATEPAPATTSDAPSEQTQQTEQPDQAAQDTQRTIRTALIRVGGAAIAAAVFALIYFLRRRARAANAKSNSERQNL